MLLVLKYTVHAHSTLTFKFNFLIKTHQLILLNMYLKALVVYLNSFVSLSSHYDIVYYSWLRRIPYV